MAEKALTELTPPPIEKPKKRTRILHPEWAEQHGLDPKTSGLNLPHRPKEKPIPQKREEEKIIKISRTPFQEKQHQMRLAHNQGLARKHFKESLLAKSQQSPEKVKNILSCQDIAGLTNEQIEKFSSPDFQKEVKAMQATIEEHGWHESDRTIVQNQAEKHVKKQIEEQQKKQEALLKRLQELTGKTGEKTHQEIVEALERDLSCIEITNLTKEAMEIFPDSVQKRLETLQSIMRTQGWTQSDKTIVEERKLWDKGTNKARTDLLLKRKLYSSSSDWRNKK